MAVTINLLVLLFAAVATAQTSCPPRGMYVRSTVFWFSDNLPHMYEL